MSRYREAPETQATPPSGLLKGKAAVITGGGTGLGAAMAKLFAAEGARVAVTGRRPAPLEETAGAILAAGGEALALPGDVSNAGDVQAAVDGTVGAFGGIDILVNNAGLHSKPFLTHEMPIDWFDRFYAVNLRGPFLMVRAAVPHMLERDYPAILNISSMVGVSAFKYCAAYGAAKAGLQHLTKVVALDYADRNLRANCIAPGGMDGTETERLESPDLALLRESIRPAPLGWLPHVDQMAQLALFLVGPHSRHITGAIFSADGGATAR